MTSLTSQSPLVTVGSTLSIDSTNTATDLLLSLGSVLAADAKSATVIIANNGTAQSITGASLQFTDSLGSGFSYSLAGNPIVDMAVGSFIIAPLEAGTRENITLQLTFASAPVGGSVNATAVLFATADCTIEGTEDNS